MAKINPIIRKILSIIKEYNVKPRKHLGQHFLLDWNILEKISGLCKLDKHTAVIEIGSGIGNLTASLSQHCGVLFGIEIDEVLKIVHKDIFGKDSNVHFIYNDILKVNFRELIAEVRLKYNCNKIVIAGNIPYNITAPLIIKITEFYKDVQKVVLMVQEEVATRICAVEGSKDYGIFSIKVQYYFETKKVFNVPKKLFYPPPEVDSSVVEYIPRQKTFFNNAAKEKLFFNFINAAFSQRRKTLYNALYSKGYLNNLSREQFTEILKSINLPDKARAEAVSIEKFCKIFEIL